ncbi:hypothetical protein Cgig2_031493 [Carnegiea gigantea]|uniref:Uncharacterized protein n=1 Tax=Carnegiea gigantea TaxID=171969 RepID=A0A9Q1K4L4_9CARY|nr:hypothetical protein Cgig2_031493 [Carnegiea gigantea]
MGTKPLTSEAIALAEKKMDMSLDDIIKMSKSKANAANPKKHRVSNKSQRFFSGNQDKTQKMRQYMNSRSTLRQGVLAQKRSSFQWNSFPLASEAARKAAVTSFRSRAFSHNRAAKWNKPRPGRPLRQQGNLPNRGNAFKAQNSGKALPESKPRTLDSLFAGMKEHRMRSAASTNNASVSRGAGVRNQVKAPWLRRRFGDYRI